MTGMEKAIAKLGSSVMPEFRKEIVRKALAWAEAHQAEYRYLRMEKATIVTATGRMPEVDVAVFADPAEGKEVFTHTFVTDAGSIVRATAGVVGYEGIPIMPLPFSFIGRQQFGFRMISDGRLMDAIWMPGA